MFEPLVERASTPDHYHLRFVLPGIPESDLEIQTLEDRVIVRGRRRRPPQFRGPNEAASRIRYGRFIAEAGVPESVDASSAELRLHDGVLDVRIPRNAQPLMSALPVLTARPLAAVAV